MTGLRFLFVPLLIPLNCMASVGQGSSSYIPLIMFFYPPAALFSSNFVIFPLSVGIEAHDIYMGAWAQCLVYETGHSIGVRLDGFFPYIYYLSLYGCGLNTRIGHQNPHHKAKI